MNSNINQTDCIYKIQYMNNLFDESAISTYVTPEGKYQRSVSMQRHNQTDRQTRKYRHVPIFGKSTHRVMASSVQMPYVDQIVTYERQVINYDFCGCENKMTPCDVIAENFLKNISLKEMKLQYEDQVQKCQLKRQIVGSYHKKSLLKNLPKQYPQLFMTHLNNLVRIISPDKINEAQFECLAAIQYHCKLEYLTYFLFKDMKKYFNNKQKFIQQLDSELIMLNTNLYKLKFLYNEKGFGQMLQAFINDYYDSVGANLIPISYYAKFMATIYKQGSKNLVKMLTNFIVIRRRELEEGFRFLRFNQLQRYRNFMRQLNFDDFINKIQ